MPQHRWSTSTLTPGRLAASALAVALAMTACGSDEPEAKSGPRTAHTASPTPSASTQTPTPRPSPSAPFDPCLLTHDEVSSALHGRWETTLESAGTVCLYKSSRGAIFVTMQVNEPDVSAGLDTARAECSSKPREVPATKSFACVEHEADGDVVLGNIIARDKLWMITIVPGDTGDHDPHLDAMTALLRNVRTT